MRLPALGRRICILGPSNSGKSTLANAIARKHGLPAIHLDQLHHLPGTDWQPRPPDEFTALHDEAILGDAWVMDGNYSNCMPQRLQRATGIILLDISTPLSLFRYVRRCLSGRARAGALEGGGDRIKWEMIHYIAVVTPGNRRRNAERYRQILLPKIRLASARAIGQCYRQWDLER
ncbi:P-loop NTPase family protein [Dyella agri]|uniref:AAA family ATPase n=1 Tax=Dyella agri TaxID=1926869 RepID=A0ABW8KL60_9GAMM